MGLVPKSRKKSLGLPTLVSRVRGNHLVLQQGLISKVVYQICGIHYSGTLKLFKLGQRKNSNLSQVRASYWICLHTSVQSGIASPSGTAAASISDRNRWYI